jgi:GGDEF domain-containing protein
MADPGLRARLASRYEASPALLLVDVYERGAGERWRMPADSPYLPSEKKGLSAPEPAYPPASTILLSAPLKGDSSGRMAVDALYASLPQLKVFEAFRDALIGLGAFLALAAFILALVSGKEGKEETQKTTSDGEAPDNGKAGPSLAAELAAEGAHYQFETLSAEGPGLGGDEEFDIPIMGHMDEIQIDEGPSDEGSAALGLSVKVAPEELDEDEREAAPHIAPAAAPTPAPETIAPARAVEEKEKDEEGPSGLYSPASDLGWESYMSERLDAELSRSASFEQDLSVLVLAYDGLSAQDPDYRKIAAAIKEIFSFKDLAFERGDDGFSIILPNIDSPHALRMADELNKKLVFLAQGDFAELELLPLYMGISSRSGRLVDSDRLLGEAAAALERARYEKDTHIVAFKPDPDKYRLYLASKGA